MNDGLEQLRAEMRRWGPEWLNRFAGRWEPVMESVTYPIALSEQVARHFEHIHRVDNPSRER